LVGRFHKAIEGQIFWLPGLEVSDIPDDLPSGISISVRSSEVGIMFDGIVGSLQLRNGDHIQVTPKVGDANFLHLLVFATGGLSLLKKIVGVTSYSKDDGRGLESFVAEEFVFSVDKTIRRGLAHEREWVSEEGLIFSGRVELLMTERRIAFMHQRPVISSLKRRTLDTAENRLVALALQVAEPHLSESSLRLARQLRRKWPAKMGHSQVIHRDLKTVESRLITNNYRGVRDYYRELIGLTHIVLNIAGLGFDSDQFLRGSTYLINTATVFEEFIRKAVQMSLDGCGMTVSKGGLNPRTLYMDGSYRVQPDVVIERDRRCLGVIDAKYKMPTSSDHYQMLSYLENFGVERGALLRPSVSGDGSSYETFTTSSGKTVDVVAIDLTDVQRAVDEVRSYVSALR